MQNTEHTLRSCVFNKDNNTVKAPHTSLSDTLCFDSNIQVRTLLITLFDFLLR